MESWPTPPNAQDQYNLFELDIKGFFPSLDRQKTLKAIQQVHDWIVEKRPREDGLWFYINKNERVLDRAGKGADSQYYNISFAQLMHYMHWELHQNCLFTMGNKVFKQIHWPGNWRSTFYTNVISVLHLT